MEIKNAIGKKFRFQLSGGIHYTGYGLGFGNTYLQIRDIRSNLVFLRIDSIIAMEVVE